MSFAANFIHIRDKYGPSRALEYGTSIGLSRDLMEELALLPRGAQPSDAGHLSDEQIETVAGKLQRTQDEFKSQVLQSFEQKKQLVIVCLREVSKNWNRILLYGLLAKIAKDTLLVEWITSTSDVTLFEAVKSVVMKSLDDAETTKQANENDLFWRLFAQIVMRTDPDFLTLMYACFVSGKLDNLEDPQVLCRVVRLQQRNGFVF